MYHETAAPAHFNGKNTAKPNCGKARKHTHIKAIMP